MSSSLNRSSSVRKSFRLEITLEKKFVDTTSSVASPETELPPIVGSLSESKNWGSDPRLLVGGDQSLPRRPKKSASFGSLSKPFRKKEENREVGHTMNQSDVANGASSQKTKPGPVTRIKTVIRSTKETIVEKLPGGSSKSNTGWLSRSRPKSVGASQRYGIRNNGSFRMRDSSLSPPRERKPAAQVDRSRSFNGKSRVNLDKFVSKRCEVWERKSRDSSPERILPVDLPVSNSKRKSLIKQRTAQLFETKTSDSSALPSKKQLLLDLNGRTPKGTTPKDKPPKPQLKPKRINLFKHGRPVKPTEIHSENLVKNKPAEATIKPADPEKPDLRQTNGDPGTMGKTCSLHHQEGSVIEDDYGIDVLKAGYDHCNGITSSSSSLSIKSSPDRRPTNHEKENQNVVSPSKNRTISNSSKTSTEAVQSNNAVPNGVLTERREKTGPNNEIPLVEVRKRQTVATLNGIKLVDEVSVNTDTSKQKVPVSATVDDDDVFENFDISDKRQTIATLNGVNLAGVNAETEKGGYYFIDIINKTKEELNALSRRAEKDLESELPEEASGKLRATIGKTSLLTTKKFKQFRGLCEENNHPIGGKSPTSEDLAGFWDLVMIQVDDVRTMFEEIDAMRKNSWQSPRRVAQVQQPEARTPKRKPRAKAKSTTPNGKSGQKDAERAAKAKQQREEARRRLLAAKKAMRRRTLSGSISDEGAVEIYL